jgi:radical SAM superfamily enzyme YgiQ (UPF0313 family)
MKILFLQPDAAEYIGVMSISAVLKQNNFNPRMCLEKDEHKILDYIDSYRPDIIAFSCMTPQVEWFIDTLKAIKKRHKCLTVAGGPHPTFMPEIIEDPHIDIICRGEGEFAFLELVEAVEKGRDFTAINNLWVKFNDKVYRNDVRDLIPDIDKLPFPDREIYYSEYKILKNMPWKVFISSRGCPFSCSFCYNNTLVKIYRDKGRYIRRKSPQRTVVEIKDAKNKYRLDTVMFADDIFSLDKKWLNDFIPLYKKEVDLPFNCNIRADLVDEEIIKVLKSGGCFSVNFGIESGSEKMRRILLKKNVTDDQIKSTAKLLKKFKVPFLTNNMIGLPGETIEEAFETIKLNAAIKTDIPWCSILQPFPNTDIALYALENGYLNKDDMEKTKYFFFRSSILSQKNIGALINLQKFFILGVKFPLLLPILKKLICLPSNKIFNAIFLLTYFNTFRKRHRMGVIPAFLFGLRFRHHFNAN